VSYRGLRNLMERRAQRRCPKRWRRQRRVRPRARGALRPRSITRWVRREERRKTSADAYYAREMKRARYLEREKRRAYARMRDTSTTWGNATALPVLVVYRSTEDTTGTSTAYNVPARFA
jgi:hypothetical protein